MRTFRPFSIYKITNKNIAYFGRKTPAYAFLMVLNRILPRFGPSPGNKKYLWVGQQPLETVTEVASLIQRLQHFKLAPAFP